jgi:hypothetical protein
VQGDALDVRALDALSKLGALGQRDDCVAPDRLGQAVDQVDEPVLESAHIEPMDDVTDERRIGRA